MIPLRTLEIKMESVIRAGLRRAMTHVEVANTNNPLHEVVRALEPTLTTPLHKQIRTTYREGYIHGGYLIRQHAPPNRMLSAATTPNEDPRIAAATRAVIFGLEGSIEAHQNEIQAAIRSQYERGATLPMIADRLTPYFDNNPAAATRFARTATGDIFNRAQLDRYEDSGIVDGVQYSAHIDQRTSDVCRMLTGTIWGLDDPDIKVPPMHFNCRSALQPYWGNIPGKRDFIKEFGSEFVNGAEKTAHIFRSKYWSPMPHTKASATLQRRFFDKTDISSVTHGLNLLKNRVRTQELKIKTLRAQLTEGLTKHELAINRSLAREIEQILKAIPKKYGVLSSKEITLLVKRFRGADYADTIVDSSGRAMLLDPIERKLIKESLLIEITRAEKAGKLILVDILKHRLQTI